MTVSQLSPDDHESPRLRHQPSAPRRRHAVSTAGRHAKLTSSPRWQGEGFSTPRAWPAATARFGAISFKTTAKTSPIPFVGCARISTGCSDCLAGSTAMISLAGSMKPPSAAPGCWRPSSKKWINQSEAIRAMSDAQHDKNQQRNQRPREGKPALEWRGFPLLLQSVNSRHRPDDAAERPDRPELIEQIRPAAPAHHCRRNEAGREQTGSEARDAPPADRRGCRSPEWRGGRANRCVTP